MKRVNLLQLLFLLFAMPVSAQIFGGKNHSEKPDQLIAGNYNSIAPGVVFLVAEKGKVIYEKGVGTASKELNVPMRPEMIFQIGSITKQYTAVAVLQLVEQGKISLQDSISKFVEDFPYKGHTITVENLLTHTSGLVDYEVLDFHIPNAIRIDLSPKQLIDSIAKLPLGFIPGTKYNYSNSNYLLLGYIIERITGKKYSQYLQENIFMPAGLTNTYYNQPGQIIMNRACGYTKDSTGNRNVGYISMNQVFSAGALLSNASDLFKWHQALYSYKLLKKETLEKAFTPFKLSTGDSSEYGYGWFIRNFQGNRSIGHGGAIDGFRASEIYFPEKDIFIAGLSNSDDDAFFRLFENVIVQVMGKYLKTSYKDLKIPDAILDSYIGSYTFMEDTTNYINIHREGSRLYADLSNKSGTNMPLLAQSQTIFHLPVVKRIPTTIEFIVEGEKVRGLYWIQDKKHVTKKTEQ